MNNTKNEMSASPQVQNKEVNITRIKEDIDVLIIMCSTSKPPARLSNFASTSLSDQWVVSNPQSNVRTLSRKKTTPSSAHGFQHISPPNRHCLKFKSRKKLRVVKPMTIPGILSSKKFIKTPILQMNVRDDNIISSMSMIMCNNTYNVPISTASITPSEQLIIGIDFDTIYIGVAFNRAPLASTLKKNWR